jgi:hypothetical protein
VIIGGASFLALMLLLPFFSSPVADTLSAGTSSVTSYWTGEGDWTTRNASDGALRSHGRKDNFRGQYKNVSRRDRLVNLNERVGRAGGK